MQGAAADLHLELGVIALAEEGRVGERHEANLVERLQCAGEMQWARVIVQEGLCGEALAGGRLQSPLAAGTARTSEPLEMSSRRKISFFE